MKREKEGPETAPNYDVFTKEQRFLVRVLRGAYEHGIITNETKLSTITVEGIFTAYADEPTSRARILCGLISSFPPASARSMPLTACIATVSTMIAAEDTDADTLFLYMTEEEIVRVIAHHTTWDMVDSTQWWTKIHPEGHADAHKPVHRPFMAELLTAYIEEGLGGEDEMKWGTLVEAIGLGEFMQNNMPPDLRIRLLETAYGCWKKGMRFTPDVIVEVIPPAIMVETIPFGALVKPIHAAAVTYGFVPGAAPEAATPTGDGDEDRVTHRPDPGAAHPPPLPLPRPPTPTVTDDEIDQILHEHSSGSRKLPEGSAPVQAAEDVGTGEALEIEMDD